MRPGLCAVRRFHWRQLQHHYSNSQTAILSAALAHLPRHGFSADSLVLGARDSGFLDVSVQLLPRGAFDLVLFWLASRRGLLRAHVEEQQRQQQQPQQHVSVRDRTKQLVLERLRMNEPIKHQWQGALALMSMPTHIPLSLSELHALSSDILELAGDQSVDASWYSKRLSVAAIYASAELAMTSSSSSSSSVDAFVDRRFEDAASVGDALTGFNQCLGFVGSTAVGLGRSWGLKI